MGFVFNIRGKNINTIGAGSDIEDGIGTPNFRPVFDVAEVSE